MTVEEMIAELQKIEDKGQTLYVWDQYGYYGEVTRIEVESSQDENPLMIKND